jgi:hypothetical protein
MANEQSAAPLASVGKSYSETPNFRGVRATPNRLAKPKEAGKPKACLSYLEGWGAAIELRPRSRLR